MKRLIALALCLLLLAGCGGTVAETVTPTPEPTPRTVPLPVQTVVTAIGSDTCTAAVEGQSGTEAVTMTEVLGTFAHLGGPDFRLYADLARYQINDTGTCCYMTLHTGMSGDVYGELGFRFGARSEELAETLPNEYGNILLCGDFGMEQLGDHSVRHVRGETVQNIFDVYLLDTPEGCITMVISSTAQTEHHRNRLLASFERLKIS